jgi:DNA replication protein DnaC
VVPSEIHKFAEPHLAIVGPIGTAKSWLAGALGNQACRDGFSVLYKRASCLFADLARARGQGRLSRPIASLESINFSSSTTRDPNRSPRASAVI